MSDDSTKPENDDSFSDATAAVAVVVIPVLAVVYWLLGMPTS